MFLRLIIIFLSIFATILPANALVTFTDGDFSFRTLTDSECEVIGSTTPPNPLVIPATATYNGKVFTVTRIGTSAFKDNIGSYKVADIYQYNGELVLPNTIISIGDSAFMGCKGLIGTLNLPNSLKTIGNFAFAGIGSFIYDLDLPTIETELFYSWRPVNSDTQLGFSGSLFIPESVITIGRGAFLGSDFTKDLIISNSVKEIGAEAFHSCKFRGKLKLSNSLKTIKYRTFTSNNFQGELELPDSLTTIDNGGLEGFGNFTNVIFKNALTHIGESAFCGFSANCQLKLPQSLKYIGEQAFLLSKFIGDLHLPDSINIISKEAFALCNFSGELKLPHSLKYLGDLAFQYCTFNGNLILPDSLSYIGEKPFGRSSFINEILVIPNSVLYVGKNAFEGFTFSKLILGKSISTIDNAAFRDCINLSGSLELPNSLTYIGGNAFKGCTGISGKLELPESVTNIGPSAFSGCSGLTSSLELPDAITTIDSYAFSGTGITGVTFSKSLQHLGDSPFPPGIFSGVLTIPTSLKTMGATFVNSPGITEVIFQPNSQIESMGAAFRNCTGLTKVTMKGSVNPFTLRGTFNNCNNLAHVRLGGTLSKIDIPTGEYDRIKKEDKAFYGCDNIRNIVFENGNEPLKLDSDIFADCAIDSLYLGRTLDAGSKPFQNKSTIKSITLGGLVTTVKDGDFAGCTGLKSLVLEYNGYGLPITLGSNGNGKGAFADCPIDSLHLGRTISADSHPDQFKDMTSLTKLTFGPSVLKIPESIFAGCSGISSLAIPKSVSTIGKNAFAGCTGIKTLRFEDGDNSNSYPYFNQHTVTIVMTDDGRSPFADSPIESLYVGVNLDYTVSPFKGSSTLRSVKFGEFVG